MSKTSKSAWVAAERWLADIFGAKRRPLSGNQSGRDDQDGSDSTHPVLFLEAKLAERYKAVRTLHDASRKRSKGRPVVLGIRSKNRPGGLLVVHSEDLRIVFYQWALAQAKQSVETWEPALLCNQDVEP
jgi:hypothetical protein